MDHTFGDLRAALQMPPDVMSWGLAVDAINRMSLSTFEEQAMAYTAQYVHAWPDEVRTVDVGWLELLFAGVEHPMLELCGRLWCATLLPTSLDAIVECEALRGIRVLELFSNGLGSDDIAPLLVSPVAEELTTLDLSYNQLGDHGVERIAEWPGAKSLRILRLDNNEVSDDGARTLMDSPHLRELEVLTLYGNRVGEDLLVALHAEAPFR